jgi:hypothetical protein
MKRFFKKSLFGRWPKSKKEEAEFGPGKKAIVICPDCNAVYFEKSWRHSLDAHKALGEEKGMRFEVCPADRMRRDNMFEGELVVENIPADVREEVINLMRNIGERAFERDVLDRILSLQERGRSVVVRTSENQLAVSMGKQVQRAYKQSRIDNKFSRAESVARVRVSWK